MNISDNGLAFLCKSEGYQSHAYLDIASVWTCGYGHTGDDVFEGVSCTPSIAKQWLADDVATAEKIVNRLASERAARNALDRFKQHHFDAMVHFAFNVGIGAFKTSAVWRYGLSTKADDPYIPATFMTYTLAGGVRSRGLINRRIREYLLYLQADYEQK